jgi:hypothetical protein
MGAFWSPKLLPMVPNVTFSGYGFVPLLPYLKRERPSRCGQELEASYPRDALAYIRCLSSLFSSFFSLLLFLLSSPLSSLFSSFFFTFNFEVVENSIHHHSFACSQI